MEKELRKILIMKVSTAGFLLAILVVFECTVNLSGGINVINHNIDDDGYNYDQNAAWTYTCNAGTCVRKKRTGNETRTSLETCNMLCSIPLLWPKPTSLQVTGNGSVTFNRNHIQVKLQAEKDIKTDLKSALEIFISNLPVLKQSWLADVDISNFLIHINVDGSERRPSISTNESYSLSVKKVNGNIAVEISAPTYFGARHGLETLGQLIWLDPDQQTLNILHDVEISDQPAFPHRGVMIDTSRNYFPLAALLKVIDGMAASKLNVFHFHATDAASFPLVLPNNPKFAEYGAYSPKMVYTPKDIKGLIEYARIRGIRTIIEIDAPGHVNEGWNHGEGELVICGEEDVFNGHLNPDNKNLQNVLKSIYKDLIQLGSDKDSFHIGGDEVNLTCLWTTEAAREYSNIYNFWADFENQILDTLVSANEGVVPKNIIFWSSPLTEQKLQRLNYSESIVVQYWLGRFEPYLEANYKVIFSTVGHWYLDCGFGPWRASMRNGVCDPYTPWQTFYKYRPWEDYQEYINQVLGGETCLWSEQVDENSLESRIWPRAAAAAERLWSDPDNFDNYDVYTRLATHRERLIKRGIHAAGIWPRWCYQNPGRC